MHILRAAFTISLFTAMSRVLGYIRDIGIAAFMGAGPMAQAYTVALRLPNFFRSIFAEGAFNAAFIPLYNKQLKNGETPAARFAGTALSMLVSVTLPLVLLLEISMPRVIHWLAPGFDTQSESYFLAVSYARLTMPYLLCVSATSLMSGLLNSHGYFAWGAVGPIILNALLILFLFGLHQAFETPGQALSVGLLVAGVLQSMSLAYACHRHAIRLPWLRPRLSPDMKQLLRKMLPGMIGSSITQLNLLISTVIASFIPGAVAYLYYADRMIQLPLALIGVALGTALLPVLSRHVEQGEFEKSNAQFNQMIHAAMLFILPAAMGLGALAEPIIQVLFERGEFTALDRSATAQAMQAYCLGLPAFVLLKMVAPVFFAHGDTTRPVVIGGACLVLNILCNLALVPFLAHVGIPLGTSIASWLHVVWMMHICQRHYAIAFQPSILRLIRRTAYASAAMGGSLLLLLHWIPADYWQAGIPGLVALLVLLVGVGFAVYGLTLWRLTGITPVSIMRLFQREKAKR